MLSCDYLVFDYYEITKFNNDDDDDDDDARKNSGSDERLRNILLTYLLHGAESFLRS